MKPSFLKSQPSSSFQEPEYKFLAFFIVLILIACATIAYLIMRFPQKHYYFVVNTFHYLENVNYDSDSPDRKSASVKKLAYRHLSGPKEIRISLRFKIKSSNKPTTIFQTASHHSGISLRVTDTNRLHLTIGTNSGPGFETIDLGGNENLNTWHFLSLDVNRLSRLRVQYDRDVIVDRVIKPLDFSITNVMIGSGGGNRAHQSLKGQVSDFTMDCKILKKRKYIRLFENNIFLLSAVLILMFLALKAATTSGPSKTQTVQAVESIAAYREPYFVFGLAATNIVVGIYNLLFFNRYFPITDGWWHVAGQYILSGKIPYRDFYLYPPPFHPLLVAWFNHLFGAEFIYWRIFGIIVMLIMCTSLFLMFSRFFSTFVSSFVSILTMVVFQSPPWNHTSDFNALSYMYVILATLFFYKFIELKKDDFKKSVIYLIPSGFFISILFMSKQSCGVLSILTFIFLIVLLTKKNCLLPLFIFFAALLLPMVPMYIWLARNNALGFWGQQVFIDAAGNKGGLDRILFSWVSNLLKDNLGGLTLNLLILYFFYGKRIFVFDVHKGPMFGWVAARRFYMFALIVSLCLFALIMPFFSSKPIGPSLSFLNNYFISTLPITVTFFMFIWFFNCLVKYLSGKDDDRIERLLVFLSVAIATFLFTTTSGHAISLLAVTFALGLLFGFIIEERPLIRIVSMVFIGIGLSLMVSLSRLGYPIYSWLGVETSRLNEAVYPAGDVKYLKGFYLDKKSIETLSEINAIVQRDSLSGDTIFTFPHIPIFYLMNDRYPDTFAFVHWYDVTSDKICEEDAVRLKQSPPKVIIVWQDDQDFVRKLHEKNFRRGKESGQRAIIKVLNDLTWGLTEHRYILEKTFTFANKTSIKVWKRI